MKKDNQEKDNGKFKTFWSKAGITMIILAVLCPFIIILVTKTGFTTTSIGNLGTLGDFFGGTTVGLLSLASIFFIIHSITIQGEDLKLTREEFKTGNSTAKVQQIDNAFFNMLSLHHQIVNNISITSDSTLYQGRAAIEKLKKVYDARIGERQYMINNPGGNGGGWQQIDRGKFIAGLFEKEDSVDKDVLNDVYEDFHNDFGNDIGHYMRFNYRIVKFIVNNIADELENKGMDSDKVERKKITGDRRYYFGMLRAQWSNAEFELILINSLYYKNNKFKKLILKYDVLDIEDKDNQDSGNFKLKEESWKKFKAYRKLIEVNK